MKKYVNTTNLLLIVLLLTMIYIKQLKSSFASNMNDLRLQAEESAWKAKTLQYQILHSPSCRLELEYNTDSSQVLVSIMPNQPEFSFGQP